MKRVVVLLLWLVPEAAAAFDIDDAQSTIDLSGQWLFHSGDSPAFASPQLDDRDWEPRRLPSRKTPWAERWTGYGWYRLHLRASERATQNGLLISLGPAREAVELYVNGNLIASRGRVGSRPRGGSHVLSLVAPLPAGLLITGENVIAARIYDPTYDGGMPLGPLLLGPPNDVLAAAEPAGLLAMATRVALGLLALWLGFSQLLGGLGRRASRENAWLFGAGVGLCALLLSGTGVFEQLVPNLALATRLAPVGGAIAILCLGRFFAGRYDDWGARHVTIGTVALGAIAAILLLAWGKLLYVAGDAALLVASLVVSLYAANLLSNAARRQERGALPIFFSVIGMAALLVYDAMLGSATTLLMPPWSVIGAVGVLFVTTATGAANTLKEHDSVLLELEQLKRATDTRVWMGILDASALSITEPGIFLDAVVHEAARDMQVRRCSLALVNDDGDLTIRASVGLPTAARGQVISAGVGIAGWVFMHGQTVTSTTLPRELASKRRGSGYSSEAFICHPLQQGGHTLGVLNISDRNDGGAFSALDEIAVTEVASKLCLVLSRMTWNPEDRTHGRPVLDSEAVDSEVDASVDAALDSFGEPEAESTQPESEPPDPKQPDDDDLS